ncbi:uncharacterized protein A4U43_C05F4560 [Asparagus officinalis]|uniref:CN hydrolase domain-containing protein n=1 Tax=Asparagus officinalis TaxID=4686 RepID=A0A5P1EUS7_ASPOF|nr:uncharacterized protein A4U43_C05F4560 [Asparagus officinalis]
MATAYKPEQARVPPVLPSPPPPISKFKIALCQLFVTTDKERNIAHTRKAIEEVAGKGDELVLLPGLPIIVKYSCSFPSKVLVLVKYGIVQIQMIALVYAEDIEAGGDASPSYSMLFEAAHTLQITIIGGSIPE